MPPWGMIAVFLDLAVMGKEFITTQLELTTSTVALALPVNCPDQFWCIGLNHLFCTKEVEEQAGHIWKCIDCGNISYYLSGKQS